MKLLARGSTILIAAKNRSSKPYARDASFAAISIAVIGACLALEIPLKAHADVVDELIAAQMKEHHIVGLSLAIIQDGRIAKAKGYGFTNSSEKTPVTSSTLFQAGSISKSVAAMAALHLVELGKMSLDADVNTELETWKIPENEFTKDQKVTLRRMLSHSAGLTVHGFPGYDSGSAMPTLIQVLDGSPPANTPAIRVESVPGSTWSYSGGGYTVMQELIVEVTHEPFPKFMRETVLGPLGMVSSSYEQPLPERLARQTATGYSPSGKVLGQWHIYPEMAAAGLWTTASDLARFAIAIQRSLAGTSNPVISQATARLMLTAQKNDDGLGVFLRGSDRTLRFFHDGRDEGFDAKMTAQAETGQGAVIMINANDDSGAVRAILEGITRHYHWPDSSPAK